MEEKKKEPQTRTERRRLKRLNHNPNTGSTSNNIYDNNENKKRKHEEEGAHHHPRLRRCSVVENNNYKNKNVSNNSNPFDILLASPSSTSHARSECDYGKGCETRSLARKWTFSDRDCSDFKDKLVIVSYNILGVENASKHPDLYCRIPKKYVEWNNRRKLICNELCQYDPSILCFQEVDRFDDLKDAFQMDGYQGIFKGRTGDACDGCAIFWKAERCTLLHEEAIEFQSFDLRHNVAQLCVLKINEEQTHPDHNMSTSKISRSKSLVVGNIHVLYNPRRGDIKLGQIRVLLEKAYKLSEEWGHIPVVLAGDWNSLPNSPLYEFISSAKLDILQYDKRKMSGQIDVPLHCSILPHIVRETFRNRILEPTNGWSDEALKLASGKERVTSLQHHLKLHSAYFGVPGNFTTRDDTGEPLATSCHSKFTGTVDYLWHTDDLVPVRVLETLPLNILRTSGGLPNERWGSDHLALVCEFALTDDAKSEGSDK